MKDWQSLKICPMKLICIFIHHSQYRFIEDKEAEKKFSRKTIRFNIGLISLVFVLLQISGMMHLVSLKH